MKKQLPIILGLIGLVLIAGYFLFDHKHEIPALLERQGPISTTSEWANTKRAIEGLQLEIRKNPENYKVKLYLALAYMQEARITGEHPYYYPAALDLIDEVLDHSHDNDLKFQASVAKASVHLSLHHFKEALEIGEEIVKQNPNNAEIYGVLCDANVELGNYENAVAAVDKMVSLRPDLRSYSRVSYLREIYGDIPGSINAMIMAVKAGMPGLEQTAWTRVTLGKLYEKQGDLANAELQYRIALEQTQHYAFAVAGLARIQSYKKNYKEAIVLYQKSADIIPEFSFTEELASTYNQSGEKDKGRKEAESVIGMLKEDSDAGHAVDLELANLYAKLLDDNEKALEYAEIEYKKRPANIDVNRCLALIYYKKNDFEKANQYLVVANKTNRQDPELICLTGLINYKSGKQKEGVAYIKKSFEMNPYQNEDITVEAKKLIGNSITSIN
jgi:tetratricopeptide (TPR) repeat protein